MYNNICISLNMGQSKKKYITKRLVAQASKSVFKKDASKALIDNGYVVIAKDGWIVKEYIDGVIEKIRRIEDSDAEDDLILD